MDGKILSPTLPIKYGEGQSYYVIDVYRPTLVKEVMLDGNIIRYLNKENSICLIYSKTECNSMISAEKAIKPTSAGT